MKIIAFINQKGGVGKSTLTLHTASYLVKKGHKVLTIDLDSQGNLTQAFGVDTTDRATLKEVLLGEVPINEAIYGTQFGYLIPSDIVLGHSERQIAGAMSCETLLRKALFPFLRAIKGTEMDIDYVLIDCPPAFNVFTHNALTVATDVVIPCKAEQWSLDALDQFLVIKKQVEDSFEKELNIAGVVINMFQSNIKTQQAFVENFRQTCKAKGIHFVEQPVRQSTDVNTAIAQSLSVFDYRPRSDSAKDLAVALDDVMKNVKGDK